MCTRLVFICFTLLASAALAAALSVTAVAQPAPPRVVQTGDGSLYVVQGANAWPLIPDQIDDAELGVLNLGAEVDGTLPASLLIATAPEAPAAPALAEPAPPVDAAPPPPAPAGRAAAVPTTITRRAVPPAATATPGAASPAAPGPLKR